MSLRNFRCWVRQDVGFDAVEVFLVADDVPGHVAFAQGNGTWKKVTECDAAPEPFLRVSNAFGARDMLEAVRRGIAEWQGEKQGVPLQGRLEATERHLEDMRSLVFMIPALKPRLEPR